MSCLLEQRHLIGLIQYFGWVEEILLDEPFEVYLSSWQLRKYRTFLGTVRGIQLAEKKNNTILGVILFR